MKGDEGTISNTMILERLPATIKAGTANLKHYKFPGPDFENVYFG